MASVKKNYFYNLLYQIFLLIIPLLVTPYLARTIGEEGSGRYAFSASVATYFTLFASLGFGYYAQRLVASHKEDPALQARDFWEVVFARAVAVAISLAVYLILLFSGAYAQKYRRTLFALGINVLAVGTDITFYFQGNELFGKIVLRNISARLLGFIGVFLLVKDAGDVWIYAALQSVSLLLGGLSLWFSLPKDVLTFPKRGLKPWKHVLPTLVLFLPTVATSVYTALDKTLIGVITGSDKELGNYEYAERLVKMALTVLTSLGAVMIPRNAERFACGDKSGVKRNIFKSVRFALLLGVPLCLGLAAVAGNLTPWYLGTGYKKAAALIALLSPIVPVIGLSNVFGLQYMIPAGKDKQFTVAIVCGALVNLLLNLLLIKPMKSYGAAVATVCAEGVVTAVMYGMIGKELDLKEAFKGSWRYFVAGGATYLPSRILSGALEASFFNSLLIAGVGATIYFLCLAAIGDPFFKESVGFIKNRFKRRG